MDDLFGIEQATLLHKSPGAAARATTARAVEVTQDQTGSKRTVYFNSFGKGQAIYLDFPNPGPKNRMPFRRVLGQVCAKTGLSYPIRLRRTNGEVLEGAYFRLYERGPVRYLGVALPPAGDASEVLIELGGRFYVHDLREGRALGQLSDITDTLKPADPKIYALLPYEVASLGIASRSKACRPGEQMPYGIEVKAGTGIVGDHAFRIDVAKPDGRTAEEYGLNVLSSGGIYLGSIPTALNDERGQWSVRVRDITSGMTTAMTFEVR